MNCFKTPQHDFRLLWQPIASLAVESEKWASLLGSVSSLCKNLSANQSVGVQALDTLTPLGRGQAQLLVGPAGSGKTSLAVDAIIGQHAVQQSGQPPVRCVYASVGHRSAVTLELSHITVRLTSDIICFGCSHVLANDLQEDWHGS